MSTLIVAAAAYFVLALILVVAVDHLVALFFRGTRSPLELRPKTFDKVLEVSRKYYRK